MTITEIKPSNVFSNLAARKKVVCVDFRRDEYIDFAGQTVASVQRTMADTVGCRFYVITDEEEAQP